LTTDSKALPAAARMPGFGWRRFTVAFLVSLIVLVGLASIVTFAYARLNDGRVLPGVSVAGVSVAGLGLDQATAKLRSELPNLTAGSLHLQIGDVTTEIPYADIGRDYDFVAVIEQAMGVGRAGNPIEQLVEQIRTLLAGGVTLEPSVAYDTQELAQLVAAAVAHAQVAPLDATITFEGGRFVVSPAADGRAFDADEALRQAMNAVGGASPADTTVSIEPEIVPPQVPTAVAEEAVGRAEAVASAPLMLGIGPETSVVDAESLRTWVALTETAPGTWTLEVQRASIEALVAQLKLQVDRPAVEAQFGFESGEPVAVAGGSGQELDAAASVEMILGALNGRADGTPTSNLTLPVVITEPEFSTAEAEALVGRVELLGEWTTKYVPSPSNFDGVNIRRPASLINGTVVQPGEVFDFVGVAGPITEQNGYGEGAAIIHGKTRAEGVLGGGLCSASTTMYNAALRAGFDMGARRNHAYYISRYPVGLDATIWISGSYVQTMSFTNDTQYPIVIRGINKKRSVTFQVWGVPDGRRVSLTEPIVTNERKASEFYEYTDDLPPGETQRIEYKADGFTSVVTRTVRDADGNIIHQDTMRSNYRKVNGIILLGRYPGDPVAGTKIPYGPLPPPPQPDPTPTPPPDDPPQPDPDPTPTPTTTPTPPVANEPDPTPPPEPSS